VEFPLELQEVQNLASWVREAIWSHVTQGGVLKVQDALHLSVFPSIFASRYKKMSIWKSLHSFNRYLWQHKCHIQFWNCVNFPSIAAINKRYETWGTSICGDIEGHNFARLWPCIPNNNIVQM